MQLCPIPLIWLILLLFARSCIHFRTVKSPVAALAASFFTLLSGPADSVASTSARRCFAHALLDHPLLASSYSSELDAQIRSHFTTASSGAGGPTIVLIQGPYRVDLIHEDPPTPGTPKSMSTVHTNTSTMTAANGGPGNLLDAVFLGYTLHNELVRCNREDKEQYARLALFLLTSLGASSPTTYTSCKLVLMLAWLAYSPRDLPLAIHKSPRLSTR